MKQNGQVILIVLIISALIMTVGLSLSRKSITETKIDTDEELLKQAFNTAESGIDYYLGTGQLNYSPDQTKKADVTVSSLGIGLTALDFNEYFVENNPAIFWLVGHNTDGNIDYLSFYGDNTVNICVLNSFVGSLKVDLYYKNGASFGVSRQGYNFNTDPAKMVTGFTDKSAATRPPCGSGMKAVSMNLIPGSTPLLLSISPIFFGTKVSLMGSPSGTFPSQGSEISSTGRAGDLNSGVNRKVTIQNRYRVPPFLFEAITADDSVINY